MNRTKYLLTIVLIFILFAIKVNAMDQGWTTIGDSTYYFDENGQMYKGVHEIDGKLYYFGAIGGTLYKGWINAPDGNKYYGYSDGSLATGIQTIDGNRYVFGITSAKLYYNFVTTPDGNTYYTGDDGIIKTGVFTVDGLEYYSDDNGVIASGWQTINGHTYYFNRDGSRLTGIHKITGNRYVFDENGMLIYSNVKMFIDVSSHQGTIDWDALWYSGQIDGVILRVGYWTEEDSKLSEYISNIKRLGIPYTVYLFSYAGNADEAKLEAQNMLNIILKYQLTPSMSLYYDIEGYSSYVDNSDHITQSDYQSIIETFIGIMKDNGYDAKVYSYYWYSLNRFNDVTRSYVDWIALYSNNNYYPYSWRGWQYTSTGSLPGINGNVDMNIFLY